MNKKVLISGGRAPYTLELMRILAKEGHEIHILEFFKNSLCEYSKFKHKVHIITAPNLNEPKFKSDLLNLLQKTQFDILIPTCEEALYISKYKEELENYTSVFTDNFKLTYQFHHKEIFNQYLASHSLPTPTIYSDIDKLEDSKRYIQKKKLSRFGTHVERKSGKEIKAFSPNSDYIIQEELLGMEYCLYMIVVDGHVNAISIYPKQFSINGGATNYFESIEDMRIENWAKTISKINNLTGQFSFDLFIKEDEVFAIECNPRTTSGIHLLRDKLKFEHFIEKTEMIRPNLILFVLRIGFKNSFLLKMSFS